MGGKKLRNWDWGPRPEEVRVVAPDVAIHRATKDRRRWCRGKVGVDHQVVFTMSKHAVYMATRYGPDSPLAGCGWSQRHRWWRLNDGRRVWEPIEGDWNYGCRHVRTCTECGKILADRTPPRECPDWKPRE